jgi:hypothetical protein
VKQNQPDQTKALFLFFLFKLSLAPTIPNQRVLARGYLKKKAAYLVGPLAKTQGDNQKLLALLSGKASLRPQFANACAR